MPQPTDDMLVQQVLDGQTAAFRTLIERYQDAVFAVALSRTQAYADAQDIAQETFLAAYQSLAQLKDPRRFAAWLYGIAVKQAQRHLRRLGSDRRTKAVASTQPALTAPAPQDIAMQQEIRDSVMAALHRLPQVTRETATLFYINGYTHQDIAQFTQHPVGTIKRRLHTARKQMRQELTDMVENELKQARPGKKFTNRVVRQIKKTRVWLGPNGQNYMLLTDVKGRCTEAFLGDYEARAILTTLDQRPGPPIDDVHRALITLLRALDFTPTHVTLRPGTMPDEHVHIQLKNPRGKTITVESTYAGRDALQLAVHAQVRFLSESKTGFGFVRRKDGQPMSPTAAWRSIGRRTAREFRCIDEILRTLEKDPEDGRARDAVQLADPKFNIEMVRVDDRADGLKKLRAWVTKHRNTPFEATAAGIVGAFYLAGHPNQGRGSSEPQRISAALRHLRRAHRLRPADTDIAFDLASAYVQAGQRDEAVAVFPHCRAKDLGRCNNFRAMWSDPRFKKIAGPIDDDHRNTFVVKQIRLSRIRADREPKWQPNGFAVTTGSLPRALRSDLRKRLDTGPLTAVQCVTAPVGPIGGVRSLLLNLAADRAAAWALPVWRDRRSQDLLETLKQAEYPWTRRSDGARRILSACRIDLVAVVLNEMQDGDVIARIIARQRQRHADARIDGFDAISIGLRAKCPILITDDLADQLLVRGKNARPLTPPGAARKLRRQD